MKKLVTVFFSLFIIILSATSLVRAEEVDQQTKSSSDVGSIEQPKIIEVVVPKGTEFKTKLVNEINPDTVKSGDKIDFKLAISHIGNDRILIPQGSTFNGVVVNAINPSPAQGNIFEIIIEINSITTLFGKEVPVKAHPVLNINEPVVKKSKWHLFSLKLGNDKRDLLDKKSWDSKRSTNSVKSSVNPKPEIIPIDEEIQVVLDEDLKLSFKSKF